MVLKKSNMTPFEEATVRALGGLLEELRLSREARVRFERELHQKLDSAIAHRDEVLTADLAATNKRITDIEKRERGNGHAKGA